MSIFTAEFYDKFDAEFALSKFTEMQKEYLGILYAERIKQFKN